NWPRAQIPLLVSVSRALVAPVTVGSACAGAFVETGPGAHPIDAILAVRETLSRRCHPAPGRQTSRQSPPKGGRPSECGQRSTFTRSDGGRRCARAVAGALLRARSLGARPRR